MNHTTLPTPPRKQLYAKILGDPYHFGRADELLMAAKPLFA
jgi:hypothetical protein